MTLLTEWATFYEVLGSASAALTGLQFITIALLADMPMTHEGEVDAGEAFATPTIVHFSSALFLAAIGAAPWHQLAPAAILWSITGGAGLLYNLFIIGKMRSQTAYTPVLEDWLFHAWLPALAYAVLAASVFFVRPHTLAALVTVASSAWLLLFVGVHNAWDNVVYLSLRKRRHVSRNSESK